MRRKILFSLLLALAALALGALFISLPAMVDAQGPEPQSDVGAQGALGTAFTYQGQLKKSGTTFTNTCDFEFRLYDAAGDGNQVGGTITKSVTVNDGLFTTQLDFGANAFVGEARWLDIRVQCLGDSGYTDLGRQALTAAPYALYALSTGALQGYPVTTTAPTEGQVLKWSGIAWAPATDETGEGGDYWSLTGNAGTNPATDFLGTTDPVSLTLAVDGAPALRLEPNPAGPNVVGGHGDNHVIAGVEGATIGGGGGPGDAHRVTDKHNTVGGGAHNQAGSDDADVGNAPAATVGGGAWNTASAGFATVGGGYNNTASGENATVGGGEYNEASGDLSTVGGGAGNTASGYEDTVGGGGDNTASGDMSTVGGGYGNVVTVTYGTVSGGQSNTASGHAATVGGGEYNTASGDWSTIAGGDGNLAAIDRSAIGGGLANRAFGSASTVAGGESNTASGPRSTIGGGEHISVTGYAATVAGGSWITATGDYAAVGGGYNNTASGENATVGGGAFNTASGYASVIGGGGGIWGIVISNTASGDWSTVGGGRDNTASGKSATIGGGYGNIASGENATIGGGQINKAGIHDSVSGGVGNTASGGEATVGGGWYNTASGYYATVSGGRLNTASARGATVGGGLSNVVSGTLAAVGGGEENTAGGDYATVPGGYGNTAYGDYSFAAGYGAKANNRGCFVWGDSSGYDVTCSVNDRWVARARGGVYFYTWWDSSTGVFVPAGGNSWNAVSDWATKENFTPVDGRAILEKLATLPVQEYNLKSQDSSIRHIGPVAQDLYAAFGYGESDRAINMEDADGLALAAIQGLYQLSQEQAARIQTLGAENAALQEQLDSLEARVASLEAAAGPSHSPQSELSGGWLLLGGLVVVAGMVVQRRHPGGGR